MTQNKVIMIVAFIILPFSVESFAGECQTMRPEMIYNLQKTIQQTISDPAATGDPLRGVFDTACWNKLKRSDKYSNAELSDELGLLMINSLKNPSISVSVKDMLLKIALGTKPKIMFGDMIHLLKTENTLNKKLLANLICGIYYSHSISDEKIGSLDLKTFLKKYKHILKDMGVGGAELTNAVSPIRRSLRIC